MGWINRSAYKEIKKNEDNWRKQRKRTDWLPLNQWIAKKKLEAQRLTIYIDEDFIGKIEDAPRFYKKILGHLYKRYMQNGKTSFVRHIPRKAIAVTADAQWWIAKFGEPL